MKLKVLGASGSETPSQRLSALLIDGVILMDAGTVGGALHMEEQSKIKYILLTHSHLDHIKGIPFLLDNLNMRNSGRSVMIISGKDVLTDLKKCVFNNRIWPDFSKIFVRNIPVLKYRAMNPSRSMNIDGYRVFIERVSHTGPAYGFILEGKDKKAIAYTGDTGPTELFWKKMSKRNVGSLIVGVSFPNSKSDLALKSGHLTPMLLKKEIEKMVEVPPKIFITHTKPPYVGEIKRDIDDLGVKNLKILREGQLVTI